MKLKHEKTNNKSEPNSKGKQIVKRARDSLKGNKDPNSRKAIRESIVDVKRHQTIRPLDF